MLLLAGRAASTVQFLYTNKVVLVAISYVSKVSLVVVDYRSKASFGTISSDRGQMQPSNYMCMCNQHG